MKRFILPVLILFASIAASAQTGGPVTTFILIRHAEKLPGQDDPGLTAEGIKRSEQLVKFFAATEIAAIFSTKFKRTLSTVEPLAKSKGLQPIIYEKFDAAAIDQLISQHRGKTIFIAGHSNTTPQLANQLLGQNRFENFKDDDFANILIVSVVERGKTTTITWLKY